MATTRQYDIDLQTKDDGGVFLGVNQLSPNEATLAVTDMTNNRVQVTLTRNDLYAVLKTCANLLHRTDNGI